MSTRQQSSFQKVGILIAFLFVLFVITISGLTATAEKTIGEGEIEANGKRLIPSVFGK